MRGCRVRALSVGIEKGWFAFLILRMEPGSPVPARLSHGNQVRDSKL